MSALLQTHAAAIGELPDELRTQVVVAAQERQEDASPFIDEDEMSVDPIIDEPPISDEPPEDDAYTRWVMEVREQARGCPTAGHITAYRKGRLAECAAWEDPEDATQQVMDAFDARMRQLTGAGVGQVTMADWHVIQETGGAIWECPGATRDGVRADGRALAALGDRLHSASAGSDTLRPLAAGIASVDEGFSQAAKIRHRRVAGSPEAAAIVIPHRARLVWRVMQIGDVRGRIHCDHWRPASGQVDEEG